MAHPNRVDAPKALPRSPLSPCPLLPTQLRALLRGGRLLVVGFVRHGTGDAAFAPALTVGSFATFGGDGFFLIVVFPRCVVVLVPTKSGRGKKCCWVGRIFRSSNYFSARVRGWGFFFVGLLGGQVCIFFCTRRLFSWLGASWIGGGVICGGVFFLQLAAAPPPSARRDLTETGLIPDHSNSSLPPPHLSS